MDDLIAVAPPRNEALNELRGDLDAAATHTDNDTDPQAAPSFPWASILAHTDDTFIPHRTCACASQPHCPCAPHEQPSAAPWNWHTTTPPQSDTSEDEPPPLFTERLGAISEPLEGGLSVTDEGPASSSARNRYNDAYAN